MCVRGGAIGENVGIALLRGRGIALVGRECMKGWRVMFLCLYVGPLAISCWVVASIGVPRDAIMVRALIIVEP